LFGGSGGAGGSNDRAFNSAGGGGGGGAIAVIALKSITLGARGRILARGAPGGKSGICGGGGSGGAVLLAALHATHDFGAAGKNHEGQTLPKGVSVTGGKGGTMAQDGAAGTFYDGSFPDLR
jgi:hypothetical protein